MTETTEPDGSFDTGDGFGQILRLSLVMMLGIKIGAGATWIAEQWIS